MGLFGPSPADITAAATRVAPELDWFVHLDHGTAGFTIFVVFGNTIPFPPTAGPTRAVALSTAQAVWDEVATRYRMKSAAHRGLVVNIRADDGQTYGVGVQGNRFASDTGARIY